MNSKLLKILTVYDDYFGRDVAQAVSSRFLTADARKQFCASPYEDCDGNSGTRTVSSFQYFSLSLPVSYLTDTPYLWFHREVTLYNLVDWQLL